MKKEVSIFKPGNTLPFAVMHDFAGAKFMWRDTTYEFTIGDKRYKSDWRGRIAIEELFGEKVLFEPA